MRRWQKILAIKGHNAYMYCHANTTRHNKQQPAGDREPWFGTKTSQVQILSLRPLEAEDNVASGLAQRIGHLLGVFDVIGSPVVFEIPARLCVTSSASLESIVFIACVVIMSTNRS
jgi:hypothetical protein